MKRAERSEVAVLEDIRRLLILHFLKAGSKSEEIAMVLGVDGSTIRHLFPIRKIKPYRQDE